jgi:hypothetical protein
MCRIDKTKNTLKLRFKFNFHAKKIADSKTAALLEKSIEAATGEKLKIEVSHDKDVSSSSNETQAPETKSPNNSGFEKITAIFGGGEVLEA